MPYSFSDFRVVTMASADMAGSPQVVVAFGVGARLLDEASARAAVSIGAGGAAIQQPAQAVEDVGLGERPLRGPRPRPSHQLLVVMQHQRQDIGHLPVPARALEQDATAGAGSLPAARANGAPLRNAPGLRCTTAR